MSTPSPLKEATEGPSPTVASSNPRIEDKEDASTHTWRRLWQRYTQSVIHADRTAVKAKDPASKELGDAVVGMLRCNVDLRRTLTYLEAKLTGQAQETEALEGCMRSQPRIGRKRKRDSGDAQKERSEAVAR